MDVTTQGVTAGPRQNLQGVTLVCCVERCCNVQVMSTFPARGPSSCAMQLSRLLRAFAFRFRLLYGWRSLGAHERYNVPYDQ
jgi:hypothetical protein